MADEKKSGGLRRRMGRRQGEERGLRRREGG
jgi:hypothetical protein